MARRFDVSGMMYTLKWRDADFGVDEFSLLKLWTMVVAT